MYRKIFRLRIFRARKWYECAFCQSPIEKGQYYYRDDPHPMAQYHRGQTVRQFCVNCIDNDVYLKEQRRTKQLDLPFDEPLIQPVCVELVDVSKVLLERLRLQPDEIYRISEDDLEELVCERLSKMGFEARRTGRTNRKDGGIDIFFWNCGPFPVLGAAQVKHHRIKYKSNGPDVIRDFRGVCNTPTFSDQ